NKSDIVLSKSLSRILRHRAREEHLCISQEGYVAVDELLKNRYFHNCTVEDIKRVVDSSDKQRFSLRVFNGALEICANQGHSIQGLDKLSLVPIREPGQFEVIHGTYFGKWAKIKREGLSRMSRNHIHFAKGLPCDKSVISGIRSNCQVFIYVNLKAALEAGIPFFLSSNGQSLRSIWTFAVEQLTMGNDSENASTVYHCANCNMNFPNKKAYDIHNNQPAHQMVAKATTISGKKNFQRPGIYVRGYPQHTLQADLVKYFSQFGPVVWVHFGYDFTLLDFNEKSIVEKVLSKNCHYLNGRRLLVKYKENKKAFGPVRQDRTDDKTFEAIVTGLKDVDDFEVEFGVMIAKLKPNRRAQEVEAYELICKDLRQFLGEKFFNMEVHPFGSTVTELGFSNSDIDVYLANVKPFAQPDDIPILREIKKILVRSHRFGCCFVIPSANVPIVRCVHLKTGIQCDININNMLGVFNSELIRYYMSIDPKVQQAMLVLKYWAKCHNFKGQSQFFSNYAFTMMFIFFLQQSPYYLPTVESIQQVKQQTFWSIPHHSKPPFAPMAQFRSEALTKALLLELVEQFFKFYAEYPYHQEVICPYLGKSILKEAFQSPSEQANCKFLQASMAGNEDNGLAVSRTVCVQDPLDLNKNVTITVTGPMLRRLVLFCRLGKKICASRKSVLYKLLTEVPCDYKKQPVHENADSFQVVIHEAVIGGPEWFKNLIEFLRIALETFLLFTVTTEEEHADNQTVTVFACNCKYSLWDGRKSTAKQLNLSAQKLSLVEREQTITNHMKAAIPDHMKDLPVLLSFKITVTRNEDEALICANKLAAYKKTFKSFAQFFVCNFATWFELYQNDDNVSELGRQ
ncbi:hypothetical protein D910_12824, partial [Dendroctonus ponderosae]